jgi:hypothetical protein
MLGENDIQDYKHSQEEAVVASNALNSARAFLDVEVYDTVVLDIELETVDE